MSTRQVIGAVMGVTGVMISMFHLFLMIFTNVLNRYHWMEMWVAFGFLLGVAGLLILTTKRRS